MPAGFSAENPMSLLPFSPQNRIVHYLGSLFVNGTKTLNLRALRHLFLLSFRVARFLADTGYSLWSPRQTASILIFVPLSASSFNACS
jgi:hypothetical protein